MAPSSPAPVQEKYRFVSNVGFGWPRHVYRIGTIRGALARPVFGLPTAVITLSFSMIASSDGVLQRTLPNTDAPQRRPEVRASGISRGRDGWAARRAAMQHYVFKNFSPLIFRW